MSGTDNVDLPDLSQGSAPGAAALLNADGQTDAAPKHSAQDLEAVYDVPVTVSAVLGKSAMEVVRRSISMSTTVWSRAAKSCWWKTGSASP